MDLDEHVESVSSMPASLSELPHALLRSCSTSGRAREVLRDAARHVLERAVVARSVGRRCLAHQLGEARAERAERRTPNCHADLGDRQVAAAQQRLRPLDSPRHQIPRASRRTPRGTVARSVPATSAQPGRARRRRAARELAIHQVAGAAQVREVGELLGGHAASVGARSSSDGAHGCTLDSEMKGLRARRRERLLELDEVERRLKPFGRRYMGVRAIPLDALVGTDSRASSLHPRLPPAARVQPRPAALARGRVRRRRLPADRRGQAR